jgi:hypothetical protein
VARELSLADIFQIGYYWETKILLTAVKLDLFSALKGQSLAVNEVADALNLNPRALGSGDERLGCYAGVNERR